MKKKILLLNLPAEKIIQKDQYCVLSTKTPYYWAPLDLLVHCGSILKDHEIFVIDGIAEKLSISEILQRVEMIKPDFILALSSVLTIKSDLKLLEIIKKKFDVKNILAGEVFYFNSDVLIHHPSLDAILLKFPAKGLSEYIEGKNQCSDLIVKDNGEIHKGEMSTGNVKIGIPQLELFPTSFYEMPFLKNKKFAPLITSFGCKMSCSYCQVQGMVGQYRDLSEVYDELQSLYQRGFKDLLISDLMFNSDVERCKKICLKMIEENYNFNWMTFLRPDFGDKDLFDIMKKAGCHTVLMGIESTDEAILINNARKYNLEKVKNNFIYAQNIGIKTLAIVLFGLPGENKITLKKTMDYILEISPNFLSINIFVPRNGSRYMEKMTSLDDLEKDFSYLDSNSPEKSYCDLTIDELLSFKSHYNFKFYCHPKRVFINLLKISTWYELKKTIQSGLSLLFNP